MGIEKTQPPSPGPSRAVNGEEFERACRFLNALVPAIQRYGISSSAMEAQMAQVAGALNVRGQFLATPTQVQSILQEGDEDLQRIHISVVNGGDYDLTKLSKISELVTQVESGETTPDAGLERLRTIDAAPPENGPWLDAVAFVLCGLGFGVILGLSWVDTLLGGALSLGSFSIVRLATRSPGLTSALELVVATLASTMATLLALVLPGTNPMGVAVCAVIFFVPGFGFTLGASELMTGNTTSGLIGFTRALVTSTKLLIGALIGSALVRGWATVPLQDVDAGVPHAWTWVFAPMLVLGLAMLFRVRRRDLIWPVLGGLLVWSGVEVGSGLGPWQGTFLGAFLLMFASGRFTRVSGLPAEIILLPAVMLLVPGVGALGALYDAQTQGILEGFRSTSAVVMQIAAILGGLLLGEVIWSLKRVAVSARVFRRPGGAAGHG